MTNEKKAVVKELVIDAIGVTGLFMLAYGCWLISPTVMFVIIGILLLAFAILAAGGTRPKSGG